MGNITPNYKPSIFRQDYPQVLACNRQFATLLPIAVAFASGGYRWGQVMGRNSTSGEYAAYNNSASSGLDTAACLILQSIDFGSATGGNQAAVGCFGGEVYSGQLSGLDAPAIVDLGGRLIVDATGVSIFKF